MDYKLETSFPRLLKDTYIMHQTGGFHPFLNVADAEPIFKQDCWPFIQRIHWPQTQDAATEWRKTQRAKQINCGISVMHIYPYVSLQGIGKRETFKKDREKPSWVQDSHSIKMHSAVAHMFVPNPDNKTQVCHINDDPMDYRVENLKWGTNKENHTGRGGDQVDFDVIHKICKIKGWAKGVLINEI